MNLDCLLGDAKVRALQLMQQRPATLSPGPLQACSLEGADDGSYQALLVQRLEQLLNRASEEGWYQNFYDHERKCNLELIGYPGCRARMQHLLESGRPLQN